MIAFSVHPVLLLLFDLICAMSWHKRHHFKPTSTHLSIYSRFTFHPGSAHAKAILLFGGSIGPSPMRYSRIVAWFAQNPNDRNSEASDSLPWTKRSWKLHDPVSIGELSNTIFQLSNKHQQNIKSQTSLKQSQ